LEVSKLGNGESRRKRPVKPTSALAFELYTSVLPPISNVSISPRVLTFSLSQSETGSSVDQCLYLYFRDLLSDDLRVAFCQLPECLRSVVEAAVVLLWQTMLTAEALSAFALELRQAQFPLALAAPGHRGGHLFLHFFSADRRFGHNGCFRTSWGLSLLTLRKAHRAQEVRLHRPKEGSTLLAGFRFAVLLNLFGHI